MSLHPGEDFGRGLRQGGAGPAGDGERMGEAKLTHGTVWGAIDALAARYGLSPSGLAKRAGLDATAFNRSKRVTPEGRPRWPTTESLSKVLEATGADLRDFLSLMPDGPGRCDASMPLVRTGGSGAGGFFDEGDAPRAGGLEPLPPPGFGDDGAYALEVSGNGMEPLYRQGDRLIVSPGAPIKIGDRLVLKTTDGEVMAKILAGKSAATVELASFDPAQSDLVFPRKRIAWMHRIVWVSQ